MGIWGRVRRGMARLFLAVVVSAGLAGPVAAQNAQVPVRETIDANGVDLFRGVYTVDDTVATIGADRGMSYTRMRRGGGWGNNLLPTMWRAGSSIAVTINGHTDRFTESGGTYTNTEANGATLSLSGSVYTFVGRDGTQVSFTKYPSNQSGYNVYGNEAYATALMRPSGESLTLSYEVTLVCDYYGNGGDVCVGGWKQVRRVTTVKNAYGYIAAYGYQSDDAEGDLMGWLAQDDIKLVNGAEEYCDAAHAGCSTSQSWPSLGNPNAPRMTYTEGASGITGVRRPGSTSDDIAIAYTGGKVSSVTDRAGTTYYSYADAGGSRTVTVTDGAGVANTYVFTIATERLASVTNGASQTTSFTYDSNGRLTRTTLPEGNYTQATYDARGNVTQTQQVAKSGSGLATLTTTASYPTSCTNAVTCNRPTSTTDARGNTTDYTWDGTHGGLLTVTAPAPAPGQNRPQTRYTYTTLQAQVKNASGSIVASGTNVTLPSTVSSCATGSSCSGGSSDETVGTIAYGTTGVANNLLPTSVTEAAGDSSLTRTTAVTWDRIGNLVAVDGPLSGTADTTTLRYDWLRRRVGVVSPDPDGPGGNPRLAQRMTYDTDHLLSRVEEGTVTGTDDTAWAAFSANRYVDYTHDGNGRTLTETTKSGSTSYTLTQYGYDAAGRALCRAQRMNSATWSSLPGACTLGTAGSYGNDRITKLFYDAAGRTTRMVEALGTAEEADAGEASYTANGQVAWAEDGMNNRTTYTWDGHDRLVKKEMPVTTVGLGVSSGTDYEAYTYDANGNVLTKRTRMGETIGYTFDALNRMTLKDVPTRSGLATTHTRDVYYGYDLRGLMTWARFDSASGEGVNFAYDAFGRKITETLTMDSASLAIGSQYDVNDNRTRMTFPDSNYVNYTFDTLGRFDAASMNGSTSLFHDIWDSAGRVAGIYRWNVGSASWAASTQYGYDAISRLASFAIDVAGTSFDSTWSFTYNPASQIASEARTNDAYRWDGLVNVDRNHTANGLNEYTAVGSNTYASDANGNLTYDGTTTWTYDVENRMVTRSGGGTTGILRYDPLGRLYETWGSQSWAGYMRFVHDGDALVAEYNTSWVLQRRHVHGTASGDDPMVWYEGSTVADSARRDYYADQLGSILTTSDNTNTVSMLILYDEYGIARFQQGARFLYTGQRYHAELGGMYYYKARIYSATLGRFMQTDPVGYTDGMNLYAYVGNDPVNAVDPSGLLSDFRHNECPLDAIECGPAITVYGCDGIWSGDPANGGKCNPWLMIQHFFYGPARDAISQLKGGRKPQRDTPPAEKKPDFCYSGNWQDGERIAKIGSSLANAGLIVAGSSWWTGVGAGIGGGMTAVGGALTYIGTVRQARAGDQGAIARGLVDAAGGRVFKTIAHTPIGEGLMNSAKDAGMDALGAGPC